MHTKQPISFSATLDLKVQEDRRGEDRRDEDKREGEKGRRVTKKELDEAVGPRAPRGGLATLMSKLGLVSTVGLPILLAVLIAFALWQRFAPRPMEYGMVLQSPTVLSDFTLESSLGTPLGLRDLHGQYLLVTFGYTSCPDVCPLTLGNIAMALQQLEDAAPQVTVLFVTVDPQRDTAERLASYLSHFHERMVGLTGDVDQLHAVATQFGVFFEQSAHSGTQAQLFDHTATIMLVDPDGYLRAVFPPSVTGPQLAEDLSTLIH